MLTIAVDFDGTIVDHCYPEIGSEVPGSFRWLKDFQEAGVRLILWTMRNDSEKSGPVLTDAVEFCRKHGVEFWAVNHNPEQSSWSQSPKVYAHVYIDDAAACCPLRTNPRMGGRPYVDWDAVGYYVYEMIEKDTPACQSAIGHRR